jgi:hypothetical protein
MFLFCDMFATHKANLWELEESLLPGEVRWTVRALRGMVS